MLILVKIALRSILSHKVKTILIGVLIMVAIMLIIIGNSFLGSAEEGVKYAFEKSVTGQIVLIKKGQLELSLFGSWSFWNVHFPAIPRYFEVRDYLMQHPEIEKITPVSTSSVLINFEDVDETEWLWAFGIESDTYTAFFPDNLELIAGRFLRGDEPGIVLPQVIIDNVKKNYNINLDINSKILLSGRFANQFRMREIPVVGIYKFRHLPEKHFFPMLPRTSYMDIETFRILNGNYVGSKAETEVIETETDLLSDDELDFFIDNSFIEEIETIDDKKTFSENSDQDLESIFGDLSKRKELSKVDTGAWQWILINTKTDNSAKINKIINELSDYFDNEFLTFSMNDFIDFRQFIIKLKDKEDTLINYIRTKFSRDSLTVIDDYDPMNPPSEKIEEKILSDLNTMILKKDFYNPEVFSSVYFSDATNNLIISEPTGEELIRMNRLVLEETFLDQMKIDMDISVRNWWMASAPMSVITMAVKGFLNFGVILIYIVIAIIIINTLVISISERMFEIGTMRAIGTQKSFVFKLFFLETFLISLFFGLVGLIIGSIIVMIFNQTGIHVAKGSFLEIIFGGSILYPKIFLSTTLYAFLFMIGSTLLSSIYPVYTALKIQPVDIMRSE